MPKKPPRNAFYFYMIDFKEEQKKKGVNYGNMAEVANAAGPAWVNAPPPVRAKYEARAKEVKNKLNVPEKKFTSTGICLADIEQMEREKREAEEAELKDIKNFVKLKAFDNRIQTQDIYLMDVNYYCKASGEYLIGECTVLRFNLKHGILDNYHVVVNPGGIPIGYGNDVKLGCQDFGLAMPDEGAPRSNFMQILANIIDYLKQKNSEVKTLPPIFTMPEKVAPVLNFIQQMCSRAAEDDTLFRIYKLDTLFFTLINAIKTQGDKEGFPKESLALAQLKKDPFKYSPELGCEMHELNEKSVECTKSRVTRWAFTILDSCCPLVGVEAVPGQHMPHDYHLSSILSFREQQRSRAGCAGARGGGEDSWADVSGVSSALSSCNTTLNDSHSFSSAAAGSKKEKRTNPKMRMPIDYTPVRLGPAPLVSETDFPPLSSGAGRGRGGLSGNFSKMNIKN